MTFEDIVRGIPVKPYFADSFVRFWCGDFRVNQLPNESVQCVITSPPYWGLRKYTGEQDLIWGENHCEHEWVSYEQKTHSGGNQGVPEEWQRPSRAQCNQSIVTNTCSLCGAWKGAYGLEPTPEMYAQHTIEILREIRRVLRKDGVVFWNIGDSYASTPGLSRQGSTMVGTTVSQDASKGLPKRDFTGIKPKDLCLIPFRIAIAAQEDGWWVRSVIIWSKPNPMPESVKDRPTESHEYILMLTKSAKYYWDADAVREPHTESTLNRVEYGLKHRHPDDVGIGIPPVNTNKMGDRFANPSGRNIRTVWEFPTKPYPEAHFAVFPEKLPELCIKAATPEAGCCSKCGSPWERIVEKGFASHDGTTKSKSDPRDKSNNGAYGRLALLRQAARERGFEYVNDSKTLGWQPTCKCNADKVPSIVLDPFMGSGTTLWVAKTLGRWAIGYEISEEYCELALERNRQSVMELNV